MTPMERFIREYAASIGLNPDIVMQTVLSEGGRQSLQPAHYARQAEGTEHYGREESYGPFQMHMRGGLGERALKAGYDPRDPAQAFGVAKFAMDTMKQEGLGAWHGWKGDPWAAAGYTPSGQQVAVPDGTGARQYAMNDDPRLDTPSSGRPIGSTLPGPSPEAMAGGGANTPSPISYTGEGAAGQQEKSAWKPPEESGWDKFKKNIGEGLGGMEGMGTMAPAGAQGGGSSGAPGLAPTAGVTYDDEAKALKRQKLAEVMARLNSGSAGMPKLWG
jgi:hypothetical protein